MATFNTNYGIVNLTSGTYTVNDLGDNLTATTVHQIYCLIGKIEQRLNTQDS